MKNFYPNELVDNIIKFNYIPRRLNENEHLKLYRRYWIPELGGIIKVKDIWRSGGTEYYMIKCKNELYICTSYPIDSYFESYELLHDYSNIYKQNIINNNELFTGAEIKYWFIMNNDKKYNKFRKYLVPYGKFSIQDNKRYNVIIDKNNNYRIEQEK